MTKRTPGLKESDFTLRRTIDQKKMQQDEILATMKRQGTRMSPELTLSMREKASAISAEIKAIEARAYRPSAPQPVPQKSHGKTLGNKPHRTRRH